MVVITNFPPPTEGIRHQEPNTCALVKQKDLGKGTLYIAESRLAWVSDRGEGFSLEYPSISLHAVSRDVNTFPRECLYLMIASSLGDDEREAKEKDDDDESSDEDEEDCDVVSEIRFIPDNSAILDVMFKAMSDCQALHPDTDISSEDGEEGCFDDADEDADGEYDVGAAEEILGAGDPSDEHIGYSNGQEEEEPMDVGQFDDAEPEH